MFNDKYALALHTTTPQLGIAVDNFSGDRRKSEWDLGRELSSHVHQYLAEILQPQTWQDLAFVAVAKGPGGFTGTRVGVAIARTIGQQLNIPVFGISALAAIALANYAGNEDRLLAVQMKARQDSLFGGIYQPDKQRKRLKIYREDGILSLESWRETLASLTSPYQVIEANGNLGFTVDSILDLAYVEWQAENKTSWSEVLPFYGQNPV